MTPNKTTDTDIGSLERFRQERAEETPTEPAESLLRTIYRDSRGTINLAITGVLTAMAIVAAVTPFRNDNVRARTSEWLSAETSAVPGIREYIKKTILVKQDDSQRGEKIEFNMTDDPDTLFGDLPKMLGASVFKENGKLFIEVEPDPQINLSKILGLTRQEKCDGTTPTNPTPCMSTSRGMNSLVFQAPPHITEAEDLIRHVAFLLDMQWSEA
jgi:hypothetical protein